MPALFSDGSEPPQPPTVSPTAVAFRAADGRTHTFRLAELPCPALHLEMAKGLAGVLKSVGALPTAQAYFSTVRRFLAFLDSLGEPLDSLSSLRERHLGQYVTIRRTMTSAGACYQDMTSLCRLLRNAPYGSLSPEVGTLITTRGRLPFTRPGSRLPTHLLRPALEQPVSYLTRNEFEQLMGAAAGDAVAVRDRIDRGDSLLAAYRADPPSSACTDVEIESLDLHVLDLFDRTDSPAKRADVARGLFLTREDLAPLLVLGTGLSGLRPSELLNLPASHQHDTVRGTVTIRVPDHRHGGHANLRWELRASDDQPLGPGDLYLMVHRLTERARRASGSDRLWCLWSLTGPGTMPPRSVAPLLKEWAHRHRLSDDAGLPLEPTLLQVRRAYASLLASGV